MQNRLNIVTSWNTDGYDLSQEQKEELEDHGFERALEMFKDGYNQGELAYWLSLNENDDEDEIFVQGWWSITRTRE